MREGCLPTIIIGRLSVHTCLVHFALKCTFEQKQNQITVYEGNRLTYASERLIVWLTDQPQQLTGYKDPLAPAWAGMFYRFLFLFDL